MEIKGLSFLRVPFHSNTCQPPNPALFNYKNYYTSIYYFTFCHLDSIVCGVIIAILRNFYSHTWYKITSKGNSFLALGVIGSALTFYIINNQFSLVPTIIGYPMLGLSFGLLVISALSPNSLLHRVKVPFAEKIAVLSFAVYLIQNPLDHVTSSILMKYNIISNPGILMFICTASVSLLGGWMLYTLVEIPFLKLRDRIYRKPIL